MAIFPVTFVREHGAGLEASSIFLNGVPLRFENHEAAALLDPEEEFELYWRMAGNPGSTLSIRCKVTPGVTKTCVDKSTIPSGQSKKSDFTFLRLQEPA